MKAFRTELGKLIVRLWAAILKKRDYAFIIFGLIILAYVFGVNYESIESIFVIGILFALASVSTIYKRYFRMPPAFELCTFGTVVVTVKYGLLPGVMFGALSQISTELVNGAIDAQIVIFIPARAMLGVVTWLAVNFFEVSDLFILGMIAVVAYNLMVQPISWLMGDMQLKAKTIYYTIFYTLMNFFVFSILSHPTEALLGI